MPKYTCIDCGKHFGKKDSYDKHRNRKVPCTEKKLNIQETLERIESKISQFEAMSRVTTDKELQDLWENLHHLLWSKEGFAPEKALEHLNLILYIRLIEPQIEAGVINLPNFCKFSEIVRIRDTNLLWERFTNGILPEIHQNNITSRYITQFDIKYATTLEKLIGHINRIDLERTDRDFLGHIYEYIIGRGTSSMSDDGQYFTNRPICSYAMELVNPTLRKDNVPTMIDPFCGTGGFITQYVKFLGKVDWLKQKKNIFGVDIKIGSVMTTLINLMFTTGQSFDTNNIVHMNSLYDVLFGGKKFDYIFTNPPFGGDKTKGEQFRFKYAEYKGGVSKKTGKPLKGKRVKTLVSSAIESFNIEIDDKVDCAVMLCMGILAKGGTASVVLPEGFFFGAGKQRVALRKELVENFNVKYVVSIPQDAFDNTSTKTSMLVFTNERKTSEVEFIDFMKREDVKERTLAAATLEDLRANNYSLSYNTYVKQEWNLTDEYKLVKFGDIVECQKGKMITKKKLVHGDFPVIGGGVSPMGYHNQYNCPENSILISSSGNSAGYVSMYPTKVWASDCFRVFSKLENTLLNQYLYYFLISDRNITESKRKGTAQPHVYFSDIENLQIPLPSLERQQEWVSRIDRYRDMAIQAQKLIDLMETSAMTEVKELMRHPEAKLVKLGDICEFLPKKKKMKASDGKQTGKYRFYTSSQTKILYCDDYEFNDFSIIIGRGGNTSIHFDKLFSISHDDIYVLTSKNVIQDKFLYYFLSGNRHIITNGFKGSTIKHLSKTYLNNLQIPLPPLRVQNQMKPLFDQIESLKKNLKVWNERSEELIRELGQASQKVEEDDSDSSSDSDSESDSSSDSESSDEEVVSTDT